MKIIFVLCLALMALSALAKVRIEKTIYDTTYNFEVEKVSVNKVKVGGFDFSKLTLVGVDSYSGIHYERGLPEIPVISFYVNAESEEDIQVSLPGEKGVEEKIMTLPLEVAPSQDSLAKIQGSKVPFIKFDLENKSSFWPEGEFSVSFAGSVKGKSKWLVTLYPVSYNPSAKEYKLIKNFEVKILNSSLKSLEQNKQDTMVFVVGKKFKEAAAVKKYASFKNQQGFVVKTLVFTEDATDDISLRAALQKIYRSPNINLKSVFIIGDSQDVASHKAAALTVGVTDHFYRAIDTDDYNNDINGPDIGVGRITPKDETELNKIIEKFIQYQTGNFSNEEWLKHASFLATDDKYQIAEGSHNYVVDKYTAPRGYTGIFPANPQLGGDKLYAITYHAGSPTVVNTLKGGRFLIDYSGHGATTSWAGPQVSQADVKSIGQTEAYPFVISNACITGQFTIPESFGETWIKNSAIMYWGSMDSSYWDEDDILERAMADKIFQLGSREFGDITHYALGEVWKYYKGENRSKYYWETYVTFGDPSIHLRTNPSMTLMIEGQSEIAYGEDTATFKITSENGTPIANARVALTLGERIISVANTNIEGVVNLAISSVDAGNKLKLVVYADDAHLATKEIFVTSTTNPYLVVANFKMNNLVTSELRPFEEIKINFLVKNVARVPTQGAKIVLESIDGPAQIMSSAATIPALKSNEVYEFIGDSLKIKMLDATLNDKITLRFRWTTNEGDSKTFTQTFRIKRGELVITSVDFGDTLNPENGGFGPGEEGTFFITVKNEGNDKIVNAKLHPVATQCLSQVNGDLNIASLNPGETVRLDLPFIGKINSECQNESLAKFNLIGTYEGVENVSLHSEGQFLIGNYGIFEFKMPEGAKKIPDQGTIEVPFEIQNIKNLKSLTLKMKITHPYIGDISIALVAPDGTNIAIRNREGGSADDLNLNLDSSFAGFQNLFGKNINGAWKFIVKDVASGDTGTLDAIQMKFKSLN